MIASSMCVGQTLDFARLNKLQPALQEMLQQGAMSAATLEIAQELKDLVQGEAASVTEEITRIKAIGQVSLTLEHFGRFAHAADFLSGFPIDQWADEISHQKVVVDYDDFLLGRAKVWALLASAQNRRRLSGGAKARELLELVERCAVFTSTVLQQSSVEGRRCFVTRGRCAVVQGFILGDQGLINEADLAFSQAAELFLKRLESVPDASKASEAIAASHRIAKAQILGSVWLKISSGAADAAHFSLSAAKIHLAGSKDEVLRAVARMVEGFILRAKAGADKPADLKEAIELLQSAKAEFERLGHDPYKGWASFELALAYFHCGESEAAEKLLKTAEESQLPGSAQCNIRMLRCRILRQRGLLDEALLAATEAHRLVFGSADPIEGEALVALGEALVDLKRYEDAIRYFKDAIDKAAQNAKLRAVCCIHLGQCYFCLGQRGEANDWYSQWKQLKPVVQNGFVVRTLAQRLETLFKSSDTFTLGNKGPLDYHKTEAELRRFLLKCAEARYPDVGQRISALNISKQTYYSWLKELKAEPAAALSEQGDSVLSEK